MAVPAQYKDIAMAESNGRIWHYLWLPIVVFTVLIWNRLKSGGKSLIWKVR